MYESFFQFRERPFAAAPLAKRYFPAPVAEEARQALERCIQRCEGVGLLIGPAGSGKSLLCQVLAEQFRSQLSVALLASGQLCTRRALLQAISFELGLPYRGQEEGELRLALVDYLAPRAPAGPQPAPPGLLLIVDEAHTLPLRLMEELRLITNLVRNGQPRVRLVLAGGPLLEDRFSSPKLESLNQRVVARCYLRGFDRQQTHDYMRQQIELVDGNPDVVFAADAYDAVHHATDGVPRLINQLCDHALVMAYAGETQPITAAGIEEAWADLQQLPTPWNLTSAAAAEGAGASIEFGRLDDELPAAVPFRSSQKIDEEFGRQIEHIEAHLSSIDDEFHPVGSIRPEVEINLQSADPFEGDFDEEQVVIDRYTTIETDALAGCPRVRGRESRELAAILSQVAVASGPSVSLAPQSWPGGIPAEPEPERPSPVPSDAPSASVNSPPPPAPDAPSSAIEAVSDEDLIVIEDAAETAPPPPPRARVQRKEYRQLFAQLRRG